MGSVRQRLSPGVTGDHRDRKTSKCPGVDKVLAPDKRAEQIYKHAKYSKSNSLTVGVRNSEEMS